MPRKFSDDERERVRGRIYAAGRELFARYGVRRTSIDDIARAAGIGKGTVYLFFPSKEDLLFELIRQEYSARDAFLEWLEREEAPTPAAFRKALEQAFQAMAENPLLTALFRGGEGEIVSRLLSEEKLAEHECDEVQFIASLLDTLRQKGFRPRSKPEVLQGLFHVVWLARANRDRVFGETYASVEALLLDLLCDELTGAKR